MPGAGLIAAKQPPPSGATPPIPPQEPETGLEGVRQGLGGIPMYLTENAPWAVLLGFAVLLADGGSRADHRPQSDRREEPGVGLGEAEPLTRQERPEPDEWGRDEGRSPPPLPPSLTAASAGRGAAPHIRLLEVQERPGGDTLRNRLHIVSVLCIISVLIRFIKIRYERGNDHGTSRHHI